MIKTSDEINKIAHAGIVVHTILDLLKEDAKEGMTTGDLDLRTRYLLKLFNAHPVLLGYKGFPASICISVNEEIIHGIPGPRRIKKGDVISLDLAATLEGWNADSAITFVVGETTTPEVTKLLNGTHSAMMKGIAQAIPGNHVGDISNAIQTEAELQGLGLIPEYGGHGIGKQLHEWPYIPNVGLPFTGEVLEAGMVLAIEPMLLSGIGPIRTLKDGWTVVAVDNSLSAHFEHTIVITEDGPVILT